MLKDLKNSRTLPILQAYSVASIDLDNYCWCNTSVVTLQQPKIILPSPSPLLKESQVFYNIEGQYERTNDGTPATSGDDQMAPIGSFTSECSRFVPGTSRS